MAKKSQTDPPPQPTTNPRTFKRPSSPFKPDVPDKKIKSILKNGGGGVSSSQSALPDDFFDKPSATIASNIPSNVNKESKKEVAKEPEANEDVEMSEKEDEKDASQAQLPEGFFDDPIMDAKVSRIPQHKLPQRRF